MKILITGGLGFIGINAAKYLANLGHSVIVLDNLSRKGNIENYNILKKYNNISFYNIDLRNNFDLINIFQNCNFDVILHLAAQVAVTTSVTNPRIDFEINCIGTFNLLESYRTYCPNAILLYASTNKVYGEFELNEITETDTRYSVINFNGINEKQPLDFHSPYGCSKGSGDQYVIDYARIYGLKTVSLRQSCIYGTNQFGIEDQGWMSWFSIAALLDKPITIYGSGKQVRDVLYINDLIELYYQIILNINKCAGKAYNIGGGINYTISLLELINILKEKLNKNIIYNFTDWRPGDQKIYISDIDKIYNDISWKPTTPISNGIDQMLQWIENNRNMFYELKII